MIKLIIGYLLVSLLILVLSFVADKTDGKWGLKTWYRTRKEKNRAIKFAENLLPFGPIKWLMRKAVSYPRFSIGLSIFLIFHFFLHIVNPYASPNIFESPYKTSVDEQGNIHYSQVYKPMVLADPLSDLLGYYRSGFLIVQNTFFGGQPIQANSSAGIVSEIHRRRFDPTKPYLISGDQFSVLYPRNLGVFYNQLLDPNTALSEADWENRQRIYLQSVLFAIDGLSVGDKPKTTLVPIAPRTIASTSVHPGDHGSDAVYGTLFALDRLNSSLVSDDGKYSIKTSISAKKILREKSLKLKHMVESYVKTVRDPKTGLVKTDIHVSSARDGASRRSSFYDNMILWKTMDLARKLNIVDYSSSKLSEMKQKIRDNYWNEEAGYYNNDAFDTSFSSDWLIGYVIGFFNLNEDVDRKRTQRILDYINQNDLAEPLPIKYQNGKPEKAPWAVRVFVPDYGGEAIWSYWGAQYITLLVDLAEQTGDNKLLEQAKDDIDSYHEAIVRDGGFAETFNSDGQFLQTGFYKSIRITGWVVQFEHAEYRYKLVRYQLSKK